MLGWGQDCLLLWGHWVWDLRPRACSLGVRRLGRRAGQGQGCAEITSGGSGGHPAWQSHPGPPSSLPFPWETHSTCFPEQLEAEVSGRPAGRAGWGCGWEARPPCPAALGPQEGRGGPASPGAAKGTQSAALGRAASNPPTMWFQSNCPKILLQHEPRAIHSPATNQQQSYRINRFHTRGAGQPGARTQALRPRPLLPGPDSPGVGGE